MASGASWEVHFQCEEDVDVLNALENPEFLPALLHRLGGVQIDRQDLSTPSHDVLLHPPTCTPYILLHADSVPDGPAGAVCGCVECL